MDPLDQNSGVESDLAAGPAEAARERGLAPAGSLMSVQIRRRTLPRKKVRQDKAAQEPLPEPLPPAPAAPLPEVPAPEAAISKTAHTASDAGRRMQSVAPTPIPPAPTATAPPAAPPVATTPPAPAPSEPAPKPAPPPPPVREANTPSPPQAIRPEGIISYWLRLRGSRRFPAKADLDQGRIAADWPNSILMRCRVGSKALEPEKVFSSPATAPSAASSPNAQAAMDLSPMMLQWLLGLAGDAARDRRPMQDTEAFPSRNQSVQYGAFALPFSDDQAEIDHVLCHVYRMP